MNAENVQLRIKIAEGKYYLPALIVGARQFRTDDDGKVLSFSLPPRSLRDVSTWSSGDITRYYVGAGSALLRGAGLGLSVIGSYITANADRDEVVETGDIGFDLEVAGMGASILGIFGGFVAGIGQVVEADKAGEQIAELGVWFQMYVATYVARLISAKIVRRAKPGLTTSLKTLRAQAIEDAGRVLDAAGNKELVAIAAYLKTLGSDLQIVNELLRLVEWHVARFIPEKVRQYIYFSV